MQRVAFRPADMACQKTVPLMRTKGVQGHTEIECWRDEGIDMLAMTTEAVAAALIAFAVSGGGGKIWNSASGVRACMVCGQRVFRTAASW